MEEINGRLKDVGGRPVSVPKPSAREDVKYEAGQYRTENNRSAHKALLSSAPPQDARQ